MIFGLIGGGLEGLPPGLRYPTLAQGKDTVADYLAKRGFQRVAFAANLKRETATGYGTTVERLEVRELKETPQEYLALRHCRVDEFVDVALESLGLISKYGSIAAIPVGVLHVELHEPRSPRWVTQLWGTEYRRMRYGDDYWAKQGCELASGPGEFTFTDVRMPNEPIALKDIGARLLRIIRLGTEVEYTGKEHATEIALLHTPVHATLINREGDFEGLYRQIDALFHNPRIVEAVPGTPSSSRASARGARSSWSGASVARCTAASRRHP
ncbi:hypothetical protein G3A43_08785 [Paraburkholderia aspalathi]|nr:hypothetical protein [Paraburkholderia aspalathi]MBK3780353.1 hypothetical protein [Paraburkholderia aspalathi]